MRIYHSMRSGIIAPFLREKYWNAAAELNVENDSEPRG
jgi:hypothetical protein